jgi:hypothetical protein
MYYEKKMDMSTFSEDFQELLKDAEELKQALQILENYQLPRAKRRIRQMIFTPDNPDLCVFTLDRYYLEDVLDYIVPNDPETLYNLLRDIVNDLEGDIEDSIKYLTTYTDYYVETYGILKEDEEDDLTE